MLSRGHQEVLSVRCCGNYVDSHAQGKRAKRSTVLDEHVVALAVRRIIEVVGYCRATFARFRVGSYEVVAAILSEPDAVEKVTGWDEDDKVDPRGVFKLHPVNTRPRAVVERIV